VIAYNKIDVPDSGDYWEFVREYLVVSGTQGIMLLSSCVCIVLVRKWEFVKEYLVVSVAGKESCCLLYVCAM
jgi:hypothetical protein